MRLRFVESHFSQKTREMGHPSIEVGRGQRVELRSTDSRGRLSSHSLLSCQLFFCSFKQLAHGLDYCSGQQHYYCYQG
jgi:hypothetical protein